MFTIFLPLCDVSNRSEWYLLNFLKYSVSIALKFCAKKVVQKET